MIQITNVNNIRDLFSNQTTQSHVQFSIKSTPTSQQVSVSSKQQTSNKSEYSTTLHQSNKSEYTKQHFTIAAVPEVHQTEVKQTPVYKQPNHHMTTLRIVIYPKTINFPRNTFNLGKYRTFRLSRSRIISQAEQPLNWSGNYAFIRVPYNCPQIDLSINPTHFFRGGFFVDVYPESSSRPIYRADFGPNRAFQTNFLIKLYLQAVAPLAITDTPKCVTIIQSNNLPISEEYW